MITVVQGEGKIATEAPRAATVETYGVRRRVKVIGVLEYELDTVSAMNGQTTLWSSVATALASLAIGVWITAAFVDKLPPEGAVMVRVGAPVFIFLALVCGGLAVSAWWSKRSAVKRILQESAADQI